MEKHALLMAAGCTFLLLLIFVLPAIGVRSDLSLLIIIILMLGCHLLMMGGHRKKHSKNDKEKDGVHKQIN